MLVCSPDGAVVKHSVDLFPTALLELVLQDMTCTEIPSTQGEGLCSSQLLVCRDGSGQLKEQQLGHTSGSCLSFEGLASDFASRSAASSGALAAGSRITLYRHGDILTL